MREILIKSLSSREHSVRLEARYEDKAKTYSAVFCRISKNGCKCIASCKTIRNGSGIEVNKDANGKAIKIPQGILAKMKERAETMLRFHVSSYFMNSQELASLQLFLGL